MAKKSTSEEWHDSQDLSHEKEARLGVMYERMLKEKQDEIIKYEGVKGEHIGDTGEQEKHTCA